VRLATFNVNSLRARMGRITAWLQRAAPDVACLQETKVEDERFPRRELEALGYHVALAGEPGRNGVAILSRAPIEDPVTVLPGGHEDAQARFLSVRTAGVRVICAYVPNGQGVATEAFFYKLEWLARLLAHLKTGHDPKAPLALLGDFNICPSDLDVFAPESFRGRLHCTDHERKAIDRLCQWGLVDALRQVEPTATGRYTWFDYGPHSLRLNEGLRIDLALLTAPLSRRIERCEIDMAERQDGTPSRAWQKNQARAKKATVMDILTGKVEATPQPKGRGRKPKPKPGEAADASATDPADGPEKPSDHCPFVVHLRD
jgi:exodeoxyribonuclease-3